MTKMTSQKLAPNAIQNAEDFKISKIKFESHIITKKQTALPGIERGKPQNKAHSPPNKRELALYGGKNAASGICD